MPVPRQLSARYQLSSTGIAPCLQLAWYSAVCKYWHESDFSTWGFWARIGRQVHTGIIIPTTARHWQPIFGNIFSDAGPVLGRIQSRCWEVPRWFLPSFLVKFPETMTECNIYIYTCYQISLRVIFNSVPFVIEYRVFLHRKAVQSRELYYELFLVSSFR